MMAKARKIATNLSVRADLVAEAKQLGLNLSEVFESAVISAVRRKRQEAWLNDNRQAIETYNARVAREGLFSDAWRKF
jgi:antitoxin CcdA